MDLVEKKKPQLQWHATEQNQYMFCTCKGWEIDLQIQRVHRRDLLHLKTYLITLIVSLGMLLNHGVRIKWMIKSEWGVSEISLSCVIVRVETLTGVCVPIWNSRFMWGSSPSFHYHYHPFVDGHHYLPLEDRLNPILKVVYIQKKAVFVHSKGSERSWSRILLPPPPPWGSTIVPIPHPNNDPTQFSPCFPRFNPSLTKKCCRSVFTPKVGQSGHIFCQFDWEFSL